MNARDRNRDRDATGPGFDELLLLGVILVMLTGAVLGLGLYVFPGEHLEIPELQPVLRVAEESELPVGASRVRNWGERIVLVVRRDESSYFALQGTSPLEGCILRWNPESLRVTSPCRYVVYDLRGDVVAGLTNEPLQRYSVFVRDGVIYVADT